MEYKLGGSRDFHEETTKVGRIIGTQPGCLSKEMREIVCCWSTGVLWRGGA